MTPAAMMVKICVLLFSFGYNLDARAVMVQNKNIMVAALKMAELKLIHQATLLVSPMASRENILPIIKYRGAPGWWPTSSLLEAARNSPASQKLSVGSIVSQ
ncbi:hypothetical protein D3C87_1395730 [compost metagenome]